MYERMLEKGNVPKLDTIRDVLKLEAFERLERFELLLNANYTLIRELKFPFGNNYGWGYKYAHKTKHLCYAFFEKSAFSVFTQIGDKQVTEMEGKLTCMSSKAKEVWKTRYPCGEFGGWINFRILSDEDLQEAFEFIKVKVKPAI